MILTNNQGPGDKCFSFTYHWSWSFLKGVQSIRYFLLVWASPFLNGALQEFQNDCQKEQIFQTRWLKRHPKKDESKILRFFIGSKFVSDNTFRMWSWSPITPYDLNTNHSLSALNLLLSGICQCWIKETRRNIIFWGAINEKFILKEVPYRIAASYIWFSYGQSLTSHIVDPMVAW